MKVKILPTKRALCAALIALLIGAGATNLQAQTGNINFADELVRNFCVANWDTNKDRELSYDEAAAVTDLGTVFKGQWYIFSFNELQYFTGLTSIGDQAFRNCFSLASIAIPNTVTSIGTLAFSNCTSLTSVAIPDAVTSIGIEAFHGCTGLTSVEIPDAVTSIGASAFRDCTGLTSVEIPDAVTSIERSAFSLCTSLSSVKIPNSVTSIGEYAFYQCSGLTSLELPNTLTSIGGGAFLDCTSLTSLELPSTLTYIGNSAFAGCTGLASITVLANNPPNWGGAGAFNVVDRSIPVFIPAGTMAAYQAHQYWSQFTCLIDTEANINFADNLVKGLCIARWDTDHNGELTYGEAAALTTLGEAFKETFITSFDELQYFMGLDSIGLRAFYKCTSLTSVKLPIYITSIGNYTFYQCTGLTSIKIPASVTSIGEATFCGCTSLTSIEIPNSVTSIGNYTFYGCTGLTSLVVGNAVATIGKNAFFGCADLTSLEIPDAVTHIGERAFAGCTGLDTITVLATVPPALGEEAFNNVDKSIPVHIPAGTYSAYRNAEGWSEFTNLVDPDLIVFADAQVKALCVANWDTNGDGGLSYAEAAAVTDLGVVFRGQWWITSFDELQYFTGLTSIGNDAFNSCLSLTSIVIPDAVTSIGYEAFNSCFSLSSIAIPNAVTSIGSFAFQRCNMTSIEISASVTSIGEGAFSGCNGLVSLSVATGNTKYDSRNNCNAIIETATNTLVAGSMNTVIPNNVTSIGNNAFNDFTLISVDIPASVTSIGDYAFNGCGFLKFITVQATTPPVLGAGAFNYVDKTIPVFVPAGTVGAYQAAEGWSEFTNYKDPDSPIDFADANVKAICAANWGSNGELTYNQAAAVTDLQQKFRDNKQITSFDELQYFTGLTSIGYQEFAWCTGLTSITFPYTITSIGNNALVYCTGLSTVEIPNAVTSIGNYAFAYCDGLTWFEFSSSLTSIGYGAFTSCDSLTYVSIPYSVTSIGDYAFDGCDNLIRVELGMSLTSIGEGAFSGCPSLAEIVVALGNPVYDSRDDCNAIIETATNTLVTGCMNTVIPNSVTSIGENAFAACTSLASVVIPNSVTSIGNYAFSSCTGLTSLEIGNAVTSIGDHAFYNCSGLASITVWATVPPSVIISTSFSGVERFIPVYVPCESVNAYGSAYWGRFSNFIGWCGGLVSVSAYPAEGGTVTDGGAIAANQSCTVTATAKAGYVFSNWTKNGAVASYDETYTFFVEGDLELVAHFLSEGNIDFADAEVKAICVANWDTNGDDELSYIEAAAVANLGTVFSNKTNITSFDELQHFTGLTAIEWAAFSNSSLTSVKIPASVTYIEGLAFEECRNLASVEIPASVTNIGDAAFYFCTGLTSITSLATVPPTCGFTVFYSVDMSIPVYVPCVALEDYQNAPRWSSFRNFVGVGNSCPIDFADDRVKAICVAIGDTNGDGELSYAEAAAVRSIGTYFRYEGDITSFDELQYFTSLTSIRSNAFERCTSLTSVTIPNSVTSIEDYAFNLCRALTSVTIPSSVTTIGERAFSGCQSLTSVEIPAHVTSIGNYAFSGCDNLASFEIPAHVTSIGEAAFYGCFNLTSLSVAPGNIMYDSRDNCNAIIETITNTLVSGCQNTVIPNTVTSIGVDAFAHCHNLSSIVIPESVTSIGETAFQGCSGLTSVEIGNAVTSIGQWAFYGCQTLGSVEIPASVTSIGRGAFEKCLSLSSLTVLATVPPTLGEDVFKDVNSSFFVYVPCLALEAYQNSPWSVFTLARTGCDAVVNVLPVTGFGSDPTAQGGWYLIASPLVSSVEPADVGNMLSNAYDLYAFDGSQETKEWRNFKNNANNGFNRLSFGQGYLYANSNNVDLEFVGEPFLANSYTVTLQTDDTKLGDWNLVGNSFSTEATVSVSDYYRIVEGSRDKIVLSSGPVNAMEGIFVSYAAADAITITEEGTPLEITFTKATRGERAVASPMVNIDLRNAEGRLLDRARLRTGEGASMSKLELLSDPNRLYFRTDGKDYAVARVNGQGEMPLHFEAAENGTYTLSVNIEGMDFSYLHLIDNMTGADVDLLATSTGSVATYTFYAKTTDYASRFKLVFSAASTGSAADEAFAFIDAGGNIVITADAHGASLQVIDMMGRVIVCRDASNASAISTTGIPAGMYVLRLIDGENVRTQKIVVQ